MRKKILLIEDNPQNRYLETFILKKNGFEIYAAEDGESGIHLAGSIQPDLILLDIQLPKMDGFTVARILRKNPKLNAVPIVAVTSLAMVGDKERILSAGCSGYIDKPIDPDTFIDQIFIALSKSGP